MYNSWIDKLAILDRSLDYKDDIWYAFALDELLCEQVAIHETVVCHLWCHTGAVILGQRDARLPYVQDAITELESQEFKTCVRHSGGAAVPLDKNVLNISLIFPLGHLSERSYHDGFEHMYELISTLCEDMPYTIEKGEIKGAYCPGDYDLSVDGLKFCGIAQRRKVKAYIVQAFINIDGDSVKRGEQIAAFYERATQGEQDIDFPHIIPQMISSLSQFCSLTYSQPSGEGSEWTDTTTDTKEVEAFTQRLKKRNKRIIQPDGIIETEHNIKLTMPTEQQVEAQARLLKARYNMK